MDAPRLRPEGEYYTILPLTLTAALLSRVPTRPQRLTPPSLRARWARLKARQRKQSADKIRRHHEGYRAACGGRPQGRASRDARGNSPLLVSLVNQGATIRQIGLALDRSFIVSKEN